MTNPIQNDIAKTALIPLWARAKAIDYIEENHQEWKLAKKIIKENYLDVSAIESISKTAQITTILDIALRSVYINNILDKIDQNYQIINFGAGFDLKSELFKNKLSNWINVDVKEINELRKDIFDDKNTIEGNILDFDFKRLPNKDSILILEGVAMYFDKQVVQDFVNEYLGYFPNSKLIIEIGGKWISKFQHPAFKAMNLECKYIWGANGENEIQKIFPELSIISHQKILDFRPEIWTKYSRFIKNLPLISSKFGSQIVYLQKSNF